MQTVDLQIVLEGGAGMSLEGLDRATGEQVQNTWRRWLSGEGKPVVEIVLPREDGSLDEFIIDLRRVVAMVVKVQGGGGTSAGFSTFQA